MKCSICKEKIEETFLGKIMGGYVKDSKGKKLPVCSICQRKYMNDKGEMLKHV